MLIDRPVDVAPFAGDFHVGLVDVPTVTDRVPARSGRVGEEWGEALYPPVDGDVVDLDLAFAEEFFDVSIGEPVSQVPPHGEDDDLGREPEPDKRRRLDHGTGRERRDLIPPPSPPRATWRQCNS